VNSAIVDASVIWLQRRR